MAAVILATSLTGLGWMLRRFIGSLDAMRVDVRDLAKVVHEDRILNPVFREKLAELAEVVTENTTQIARLAQWRRDVNRMNDRRERT